MLWNEVKYGHSFSDSSSVTYVHDTYEKRCIAVEVGDGPVVLSEDHVLLCDLSRMSPKELDDVLLFVPKIVPLEGDVIFDGGEEKFGVTASESYKFKNGWYWLSVREIHNISHTKRKVRLASTTETSRKIKSIDYVGTRPTSCVATDIGMYEVCGLVHHNSSAIRNIIFHSLTHSDHMKLCMIDMKVSEFSAYKGMNNVVGVANSVNEAVELLRLCREVMRKRNKQNAERGINDFVDYVPTSPTGKISLFGREFDKDFKFPIELNGEKSEMTAEEILRWVEENY